MTTIKAIIRNGRIEVDDPINLPDGTELIIPIPEELACVENTAEDLLSDSPRAIEAWVHWFDALEPLEFSDDERASWEAARQEQKEYELSQWETRSKRAEGQFS